MRLQDKVAIITGVSQAGQVGYALASAFAREGAALAISARSSERVNQRAAELRAEGARVEPFAVDLTSEQGVQELVEGTLAAYGRIDILVNLAGGLTKYGPAHELTVADWDAELNNNLRTTFLCTRSVWPVMIKQNGGRILNFSRAGGVEGSSANMLAYNCAKAGVDALTRTFAKEGKSRNILVNAIGPGLVVTESNLASMKPSEQELEQKWVKKSQIVEAAIFLVSPLGDGVNGVILPVQARGL